MKASERFVDTNLLLHLLSADTRKADIAEEELAGCKTLLSEDMQHGQVFQRSLKILNPFR